MVSISPPQKVCQIDGAEPCQGGHGHICIIGQQTCQHQVFTGPPLTEGAGPCWGHHGYLHHHSTAAVPGCFFAGGGRYNRLTA